MDSEQLLPGAKEDTGTIEVEEKEPMVTKDTSVYVDITALTPGLKKRVKRASVL